MLNKIDVCYFSPTGGTKKIAEKLGNSLSNEMNIVDLGNRANKYMMTADVLVVAAPVFGGRIPAFVAEELHKLNGTGKMAVSIVVYGNRAYDDALLELNELLKEQNYTVVASGTFIARHSMMPEVAKDRPDERDFAQLDAFAETILSRIVTEKDFHVTVPGNTPYKAAMQIPATPISTEQCVKCNKCKTVCPVDAITVQGTVITDIQKCMLCMACTMVCPENARILPPPMKMQMEQMLSPLKEIRRENETFF